MWVVVKIMVPFWVPILVRHLIFRVPKKTGHNFDNHPYSSMSMLRLQNPRPLKWWCASERKVLGGFRDVVFSGLGFIHGFRDLVRAAGLAV